MKRVLDMAFIWPLAATMAFLFLSLATPAPAQPLKCGKVAGVVDGDTFDVQTAVDRIRVRLWGVDAPERYWPEGRAATRYLNVRLKGKTVCLDIKGVGPYGRPVAAVFINGPRGPDLAAELLQKGLARWVKTRAPHAENYRKAEAQARAARRGIWGLDYGGSN